MHRKPQNFSINNNFIARVLHLFPVNFAIVMIVKISQDNSTTSQIE